MKYFNKCPIHVIDTGDMKWVPGNMETKNDENIAFWSQKAQNSVGELEKVIKPLGKAVLDKCSNITMNRVQFHFRGKTISKHSDQGNTLENTCFPRVSYEVAWRMDFDETFQVDGMA